MTEPPQPTTLLGQFCLLFHYDEWATQRLLTALAALPAEEVARQGACALAAHLLWASRVWYGRVRGDAEPVAAVRGDLPPDTYAEAYAEANARWQQLLRALPANELTRPIQYRATEGTAHTTPLRDVLTHVLHHGSHHRAQIATWIRHGGAVPPATDYIFYHRGMQDGTAPRPPESESLP